MGCGCEDCREQAIREDAPGGGGGGSDTGVVVVGALALAWYGSKNGWF